MSIGNLKDYGNKGNNFPYQLRNLQLLGEINQGIDDLVASTGGPMSTDAFGRQRVSSPLTLFDSSHRYRDNGLWATATASGGTAVFSANEGLVNLNVNTTNGSEVIRETYKVFPYQPGKSLLVLNTFVMAPAQTNLRQRVGYFGDDNGIYIQLDNNTVSFVERSLVTGLVTETVVPQSSWNADKLDGTGPSRVTLDITKAQILFMDIEWLGEGTIRVGFIIDGVFIICHRFNHANLITSTYITTASLPLRYEITNLGVTASASTLKQVCSTVISEGGYELRGAQQAVGTPITTPRTFAVAGTYYPIIGLKLTATALDAIVIATAISILGLGNGKNYAWRVVQGATITGGAWVPAGVDSAVEYNITGTSGRLGDGTTVDKSSPVQIGSSSWTAVSAGGFHTAATFHLSTVSLYATIRGISGTSRKSYAGAHQNCCC